MNHLRFPPPTPALLLFRRRRLQRNGKAVIRDCWLNQNSRNTHPLPCSRFSDSLIHVSEVIFTYHSFIHSQFIHFSIHCLLVH